jgi:hypothetical protein
MRSILDLHSASTKAHQKADAFRSEAEKNHLKARAFIDDPKSFQQHENNAQKYEEKAVICDQEGMKCDTEAMTMEARVFEINRQKNEIRNTSQAQIERLENEEKMLRGES